MVAYRRASPTSIVDDLLERGSGFLVGGVGMSGCPLVHRGDVRGRNVGVKELRPVRETAVGHQLGLAAHRASATGNSNAGLRKLPLHERNQRVDVGRSRLRRGLAVRLGMRMVLTAAMRVIGMVNAVVNGMMSALVRTVTAAVGMDGFGLDGRPGHVTAPALRR